MSPHRLKARGGAGSKISLPPPSISPHLTCKILQERRALRKLFGPPRLADHPLKPSLPPARRVLINTKEMTRHKKVSSVARLAMAPSHKQAPCNSFKKPFYVGHGVSTSVMPCRGNGSASEAFYGATRAQRNLNVNVCSKRVGKPDAPQARLSKAPASCTLQIKTGVKHLTQGAQQQPDHEKENNPEQQKCISSSGFQTFEGSLVSNDSDMQHAYDAKLNEDDCNVESKGKASMWHGQNLPSIFKANYDRDQDLPLSGFYKKVIDENFTPHDQSTRRSGNSNMLDICAGVNADKFVAHSNANLEEIDRSRDAWKLSGSHYDQAETDPSCGDANSCKSESQTYARIQEFGQNNWRVEKPRIFSDDASDVFNRICTPQSKASSPELYATDSNRNVGQKLRSAVEAVFKSPWCDVDACEFALHESFSGYQEIDDTDGSGKACVTECDHDLTHKLLSIQAPSRDINNAVEIGKHTHSLQEKIALFEGNVSRMAANLRKTSHQLDAKIHSSALLLCCIQSKLSSIEGLVTRMEACNCEDLRD